MIFPLWENCDPWGDLRPTHCGKSRLRWDSGPMGDLRRSALPVGCGEVSWRTELAFSQASLRGLGFHRVARGKAFSAESVGPLPIFPLRGGLGILYLMVLSVSHGVQFTSSLCPTKGNFLCAGQGGGGHIPRYPVALSKETRLFFSPDHFPHSSSSLSSETFIQPQLRPPKNERKSWVWGFPAGSSHICPPAPKPV